MAFPRVPERVASIAPLLGTVRTYRKEWLRVDLFAGVSVCVVMIPSVIAYAELAGLAPVHGLYAALVGMVGYAIFASSRQVITGPDAAITLLVAGGVGPLAGDDPGRAAVLAATVALLAGGLMLLAARLNAGVIADFLSKPVLTGYMSGAALILVSTQMGKLFGIRTAEHDFFPLVAEILRRLGDTHLLTLAVGVGFIAALEILRRYAPRVPGALVVFVLAIALSFFCSLQEHGVRVVGSVPRGLPGLQWPAVSLADARQLLPAAVGIVMLTFPEAILLGRALAARNRYDIRPNQELVALAAANMMAGAFQGFSVGSSQSRSTVNDAAGGKTQLVSLFAAGALVCFLVFLTPLLNRLPAVALASILISAGLHLIEIHEYRLLWSLSRPSFWLAMLVGLGVLAIGVVPGIVIGVMVSLVYVLGRLARPMGVVLQELPGTGQFHDLGESPTAHTVPGLIAYRFYAPLFFANAEHFVQRVRQLIASSRDPVRWLVIDMQAVWDIDITATEALLRLSHELGQQQISLKIARANRPLREKMTRVGLQRLFGEADSYSSVHAAVEAFRTAESARENAGLPA